MGCNKNIFIVVNFFFKLWIGERKYNNNCKIILFIYEKLFFQIQNYAIFNLPSSKTQTIAFFQVKGILLSTCSVEEA